MARTPALTRDTAYAACVAAYGPPPVAPGIIGTLNRNHIRALLTSSGMSSDAARGMSLADLRSAYNSAADAPTPTTPKEAPTMANIPLDFTPAPKTDPRTQASAPLPAATAAAPTDHAARLAALLQEMAEAATPKAAPLDLDTVRALIAAEIETLTAPRPLHITVNDTPRGNMPALRHIRTETLLAIVAQNIPAYIVGPAGSGKTTACEQVAEALGLTFYLQGAVSGAHELLGYCDAHGRYQSTPFRAAYERGGLIALDEIDAGDAAALLVMNAALANGVMSFPDSEAPIVRHGDFRLIAAANTFGTGRSREYVGRNQMDAATLDRFAFLDWPYDETLERAIAGNDDWTRRVQAIRNSVAKLSIRAVVSPRASVMGAKLLAAGMTREQVETLTLWKGLTPEDVRRIQEAA